MPTIFKFLFLSVLVTPAHAFDLNLQELDDLCRSGQTFILVDVFNRNHPEMGYQIDNSEFGMIDMDGDGQVDLSHGDLVLAQLRSQGVSVIAYGLSGYSKRTLEGAFGDIVYLIKQKRLQDIAAVVMPIAHSLSAEKLGESLFANSHLSRQQIVQRQSELETLIRASVDYSSGVDGVFVQMNRLQNEGIPVITPAGNQYGKALNFANLMGSPAIGATIGTSQMPAPYSDHTSLTTLFRSGDVVSHRAKGGVDISGDGVADIPSQWLSGQTSIKDQVVMGSVSIKTIAELKVALQEPALIETREWLQYMGIDEEEIIVNYQQHYGDLIHYPSHMPFYRIAEGRVQFAPLFDEEAIMINSGTSFAIGNICPGQ